MYFARIGDETHFNTYLERTHRITMNRQYLLIFVILKLPTEESKASLNPPEK